MPKVVLKRSSVASNAPTTNDLDYGELALNYADGRLYYKTSSNAIDYFSTGSNVSDFENYQYTATQGQTTFSGSDDNSNTLSYTEGQITVFINGIKLAESDYTATNGSSVVLSSAASLNDNVEVLAYINLRITSFKYTATDSQTTFTGSDDNSNILKYLAGAISVYLNGVKLAESDYTATNGTSVVLASGAAVNDVLEVVIYSNLAVPNLDIAGDTGTDNIFIGDETLTFSGTTNEITTSVSSGTVTIGLPSNISVDVTGSLTGNADTATKLSSTRTFALTGDVTGTVDSDLTSGFSISTTIPNNSVTINSNSLALGGTLTLDTDDIGEGSTNLYYTDARSRAAISVTDSGGDGSLSYDNSTGVITYTGPSASEVRAHLSAGTGLTFTTGEFAIDNTVATLTGTQTLTNKTIDAASNTLSNIANSSLTNSSITINGTSVSLGGTRTLVTDDISEDGSPDNLWYTDARTRAAISVTDSGGDGSLSYNSSTGVLTYTGPSASEVRAHFTGGTGVTITNGDIAIGQDVGTTSNVTFNDLIVSGNLTVSGTTTTVNTETINLADNIITLNSNEAGTPSQNSGIEVERGTSTNATLLWDEANDYWMAGLSGSEVALVTTSGTQTLTNKTINGSQLVSGSVANSKLTNSTISGKSLGSNLDTLTLAVSGTGLSGSATYNGSGISTFTVTSNATNNNTASTIVARDGSGNFSAGTITATLSGNASTATKWATARTLSLTGAVTGSASIDGSGNVSLATTATSDPTLTISGDASGSATFTNLGNATLTLTIADDSHTHDGRYYTETEADNRFVNVTGDTMSGALVINANDAAIILNDTSGSPTDQGIRIRAESIDSNLPNSEGLGIVFEQSPTNGSPDTTPAIITTGEFYAQSNQQVFHNNYHPNADKLTTARNIALTGAVTGNANFDGSGNISITTTATSDPTLTLSGDATGSATFTNLGNATLTVTVANDSHTHDGRYYTETEADNRFVNVTGDTLTGDLSMGSNDITTVKSIVFNNTEGTDHGTVSGTLAFDENFYGDTEYGSASIWNGNGGGISIYNEDGWGRVITDRNMQWLNANFNGVTVTGDLNVGSGDFFVDDSAGKVGIGTTSPTAKLQVGSNYTINASYGGSNLYISDVSGHSSYDPYVTATSTLSTLITTNSSRTNGPDTVGLVLYNDDTTVGGFSPMLLFSKRESGSSPYKATMAGIYARSPLGTGNSGAWIDGELIFATAGAATNGVGGIRQRMVINKEGNVGIGTTSPSYKLTIDSSDDTILRINKNTSSGWSGYANGHGLQLVAPNQPNSTNFAALEFGKALSSYNSAHIDYVHVSNGSTSNYMAFGLYSSDKTLNILASGNVGIGTTSPAQKLHVAGAIVATGNITAYYSDARLKKKVNDVTNALDIVKNLNAFRYVNNELANSFGYDTDELQIGLSAQDVQKVVPEIVKLAPFDMERDENNNLISKSGENYLTLDYAKLVPVLVEAIKEQQKLIEELQTKVN